MITGTGDPAMDYVCFKAILAAICTAGHNADPNIRHIKTAVEYGMDQADYILECCGLVHPAKTFVAPFEPAPLPKFPVIQPEARDDLASRNSRLGISPRDEMG